MYKKKIPFEIDCGVKIAMEIFGGKWKSCIILELSKKVMRPSELHKQFTEASPRVIDRQLRELEFYGIVEKKIYAKLPPHSEYKLTDVGESLLPIIYEVEKWGDNYRPTMKKLLNIF